MRFFISAILLFCAAVNADVFVSGQGGKTIFGKPASGGGGGGITTIGSPANGLVISGGGTTLTLAAAGAASAGAVTTGAQTLAGVKTFSSSPIIATATASKVAVFDSNSGLASSSVSTTTLGFLDATSSVQTQLDAKAALSGATFTGTVTSSVSAGDSFVAQKSNDQPSFKFEGGTNDWLLSLGSGVFQISNNNSDAALSIDQASRIVTLPSLTASRVVISNGSNGLASSATTDTQVAYLSGASGTTGTGSLVFSVAPTFTSSLTLSDSVAANSLVASVQNTSTSGRSRFRAQGNDGDALVDYRNSAHSTSGVLGASQAVFRGSGSGGAAFGSENASGSVILFSGGTTSGAAFLTADNAGAITLNKLTATTVPYLNGSKVLTSSAVTPTQLEYLSGASGTTGTGSIVFSASPTFTGTVTTSALTTSGSVTHSALTASTVPYLDGSKVLTSSAVTPTQLSYVDFTSSGQTQLNTKVEGKGNGSNTRVAYWTDANTISSSSVLTFTPATFAMVQQGSNSGGNVQFQISNTSNTASSNAVLRLDMANTSGGDALIKYARNSSTLVSEGYDNSTDLWTLSASATLGTSNMLTVSTAGVATWAGAPIFSSLTASTVPYLDSNKQLTSSSVTPTQLASLPIEQLDGFIETPSNKTYVLRVKAKYAGTINEVSLKTASGTITAKLQIGGVDVTSCTGISVTSTASTTSCTAANTFASGDTITLVTSSNSSAADLQFSVKVTK